MTKKLYINYNNESAYWRQKTSKNSGTKDYLAKYNF